VEDTLKKALIWTSPECSEGLKPHIAHKLKLEESTMTNNPDDRFETLAQTLGFDFSGEIKIGGHYVPVVQHQQTIYVSGQIPRVGDRVMVAGCAGQEVSLPQAQLAAKICVMRALAVLRQHLGSFSKIQRILRITVYVHCKC
jgi:enamine deaminase RidA (YjgF/YER057c/UK114 family)